MTEQNKKNSRLQLNEGTISVDAESIVSIDAESIVFKPQAFKACDDQQNLCQQETYTKD
ncbi:hypothetical protein [Limosilactobacillus fermentum]